MQASHKSASRLQARLCSSSNISTGDEHSTTIVMDCGGEFAGSDEGFGGGLAEGVSFMEPSPCRLLVEEDGDCEAANSCALQLRCWR